MGRRIDLHTHTFFSDGVLSPPELVSRAEALEHEIVGITDHVGPSNLKEVLERINTASEKLSEHSEVKVIPGVELTHVPPSLIPDLAKKAKENGADIVLVHGETIVEPVPEGTNLEAVRSPNVDILAHPGLINEEVVEKARETSTFLEISGRKGHCFTNGRVANMAIKNEVDLVMNTDSHSPENLMGYEKAEEVVLGAGVPKDMVVEILEENPLRALEG